LIKKKKGQEKKKQQTTIASLPIFTSMSSLRNRFPSLRSRWITRLLCKYWQPWIVWRMKYLASGSVTAFLRLCNSRRD